MEEASYPNNIAMIRRMRGLSQAYVAESIGVSRPKYIEIERGLKELTVSQVNKLKEILDVSFDDLLGIDSGELDYHRFLKQSNSSSNAPAQGKHPDKKDTFKLFEDKLVRSVWDSKNEKWWFSIVDIISILTEQSNTRGATLYWGKLKQRLRDEGAFQLLTNCQQLKMMASDGKFYKTDAADTEQVFRIIQSVPSKKAEPFKQWLAKVGSERIDQMVDPEKSIQQALVDYKRLGYTDDWINLRLKSIEIRKDLTNEWDKHGIKTNQQYATLTDIILKTWSDKTTREYKDYKGLKKENLRDNMTNEEIVLGMLAELSTTNITKARNPQTFSENAGCAVAGGNIAKDAREKLEMETGRKVVSRITPSKHRELHE